MAETTDAIDPAWTILFNTTPIIREAYHAAVDAGCSEVVAMRQVALSLAKELAKVEGKT